MNEQFYRLIKQKRDAIMRLREELALLEHALALLDAVPAESATEDDHWPPVCS